MKVAVVYNRESRSVINLFGAPNQEKIGLQTIKRLSDALKKGGHQVVAIEGDKDLVDRLEEFMPQVVKGERPGMVFNVSYGIQGQARYTHVPSILEMVGIPYVASGPLAHSLALDKVVTKMILRQNNISTPDFTVLNSPDDEVPELTYPMIVKPKSEAVSFGLKVVYNKKELEKAAGVIFEKYNQPVLVEQYIDGREVNVGLLGNNPPEILPPVELVFSKDGPQIYTYEDKTGRSGRTMEYACPAPIGDELLETARTLAAKAFNALGCYDCARVDMRLDKKGSLYILEVNSLPSLGEHGSYTIGAQHVGLDFTALANRLVEVASARYFGTPEPPMLNTKPKDRSEQVFAYITQHRDQIELRLKEWTNVQSHTYDPIGLKEAVRRLDGTLGELAMKPVDEISDGRATRGWETAKGYEDGILFIGHLDIPFDSDTPSQMYRHEAEWLYGDGIGSSRAPLVMLEFALRSFRSIRQLRRMPLGVLYYTDEGRDAQYSQEIIRKAVAKAKRVIVLRPGGVGDAIMTQRRGQRRYRFRVEGEPIRPGRQTRRPELLRWVLNTLEKFSDMSSRGKRISISPIEVKTDRIPMLLPHRATVTMLMTYPDEKLADAVEEKMRALAGKRGPKWELECISDRPPMKERRSGLSLAKAFENLAEEFEIPIRRESSVWPSVAGLVPAKTACICGLGPVARDLGTPQEAVQRISLIQRTLLLSQFLAKSI